VRGGDDQTERASVIMKDVLVCWGGARQLKPTKL